MIPVVDFTSFDIIILDCIHLEKDDEYELMLTLADREQSEQNTIVHTGIVEQSLPELFARAQQLNQTGLFENKYVAGEGTVWNEDGHKKDSVNWGDCLLVLEGAPYGPMQ